MDTDKCSFNIKLNKMEENKDLAKKSESGNEKLHLSNVMRSTLIKWLSEEYSLEEAINSIDSANITINGGEITILYDNGQFDIVKIINNEVIHLNPAQ